MVVVVVVAAVIAVAVVGCSGSCEVKSHLQEVGLELSSAAESV